MFQATLRDHAGPAVVKDALDELLTHVQRHFADEEAILERLGYDGLEEHRRALAAIGGTGQMAIHARQEGEDAGRWREND